ncbi:MAG TPA: F0F1 ATP synthase subunit epsilon [Candidatus Sulfomarinibacteraceae bacterium]|nr:F0F1 ATP synthase subunit epsilon [Candidatus Sulfomarinibacteraceae bacterium]
MAQDEMWLKILLPWQVLVDEAVAQVTVEAADGALSLRPRHVDYVTLLVPGILSYRRTDGASGRGSEQFAAVDRGILVKRGGEVLISARDGVLGDALEELEEMVATTFQDRVVREQQLQATLARLNSDFIRRLVEMD